MFSLCSYRYEYESTVLGNLSSNSFLCNENGTKIFRPTEDPSGCWLHFIVSVHWIWNWTRVTEGFEWVIGFD